MEEEVSAEVGEADDDDDEEEEDEEEEDEEEGAGRVTSESNSDSAAYLKAAPSAGSAKSIKGHSDSSFPSFRKF